MHNQAIINQILQLSSEGLPSRKIAELVLGKKSAKTTISRIINKHKALHKELGKLTLRPMKRVLILDIENLPSMAYIWGLWSENNSIKMLDKDNEGYIVGVGYQWLDEDETHYIEARKRKDEKSMLKTMVKLLDEAEIVIGHNSINFDIKHINTRCIKHGIPLPSPFLQIDTLRLAKQKYKFISNKLEYLAEFLGCVEKKSSHQEFEGFELWLECIRGNDRAFNEMGKYCKQDIRTTIDLFYKLLPNAKGVPSLYKKGDQTIATCPKCNSYHITRSGVDTSVSGMVSCRYKCNNCNTWLADRKSDKELSLQGRNMLKAI